MQLFEVSRLLSFSAKRLLLL